MFEFLAVGDYIQQILAALVVLLFVGATVLRVYLICPIHASLRERFADQTDEEKQSVTYDQTTQTAEV